MNHSRKNTNSCFEQSSNEKSGHYEYKYPREVNNISVISVLPLGCKPTVNNIFQKRLTGNEYINFHKDFILMLFWTNHDITLLLDVYMRFNIL